MIRLFFSWVASGVLGFDSVEELSFASLSSSVNTAAV
jgi:hypothetical protein